MSFNNLNCGMGPWEDFADEHCLLMRANNEVCPDSFEMVKVTWNEDRETVSLLHEVIFIDDYLHASGRKTVDEILKGFGYADLDDLVEQTSDSYDDWVRNPDGSVNVAQSPSYVVDLRLLASLICESHDGGIVMTEEEALSEIKRITGEAFSIIPGIGHLYD